MPFHLRRLSALSLAPTFALLALAAPMQASAQSASATDAMNSRSIYLQGNWAEHGTDAATVGVTLPWSSWRMDVWGSEVRGHWDVYASRWSFDAEPGRDSKSYLVGVTPTLRVRPDQGRSALFLEGGIGATVASKRYVTVNKEFSTTFNFASHVGLGMNFGDQRRHEVSVRVQHLSNASIKKPNPGENFVQLRYGYHF